MFYFNLVMLFFVFLFLLLASYSDLKTRIISNKLILFFLVFGIFFNISLAVYTHNYSLLLPILYCTIISTIVFILLWEIGVVSGGDTKLFIALSFLIPTMSNTLHLFNIGQSSIISLPIFPIIIFVISAFMLLPWIFLYSAYLLFKNKEYLKILKEILSKKNLILTLDSALVVILVGLVMVLLNLTNVLYILAISFALTYFIFKIKLNKRFYYIVAELYLIVLTILFTRSKLDINTLASAGYTLILVFIFSILIIYFKFIRKKALIEATTIDKLKEGDIPVHNYYYINKKLLQKEYTFFSKIKALVTGEYYKGLKIDSGKACGISDKDITFLKDMYNNRLIDNKIYLKKTVAFTPAVLLAFILIIIF